MRDFSPVSTRFWIDPVMQSLSPETRLMALYLATGPHVTLLGCFRLPPRYVAEDLKFSLGEVAVSFQALMALEFFTFDEGSHWCVIHDFLKWNPLQNRSYAHGLEKLFQRVPHQGPVFRKLCALLQRFPKYLSTEFIQSLETISPGHLCAARSPLFQANAEEEA